MDRVALTYIPKFDGPLLAWTKKFIAANKWRVASHFDYADLLQECCVKFLQCRNKYPTVAQPQHFMALYKTAVHKHFCTLSNCIKFECDPIVVDKVMSSRGEYSNFGYVLRILEQAPEEVISVVLALLDNDNKEERAREHRKYKLPGLTLREGGVKSRETTNEYLCSLIGADPEVTDLRGMLEHCIGELRDSSSY